MEKAIGAGEVCGKGIVDVGREQACLFRTERKESFVFISGGGFV